MNRQSVALSGLAIALVVLHHTIDFELLWLNNLGLSLAGTPEFYVLAPIYQLGPIAVPLFLFISGGFVAYAARGNSSIISHYFVQSALLRLLWPHFIWSTMFYLLVYWQNDERYSLAGYLKNYIVGYPYHFVPLLVFFYVIAPFLAYWAKRYGLLLVILFGLCQLYFLFMKNPAMFGVAWPSWLPTIRLPILRTTLAQWGIYFPLGLVYALNSDRIRPWLCRWRWILLGLTVSIFAVGLLDTLAFVRAPVAAYSYPLTAVLLTPLIKRQWIPAVRQFEYIGKRSYGVYFTHFLVIDIVYLGVQHWAPSLIGVPLLLVPVAFVLALGIPLLVMQAFSAMPSRIAYRYVFG